MKVFSFCLYGTTQYYYTGLLENIRIIQEFYPDFSIYVYLGECDPNWTFPDGIHIVRTGKAGPINMLYRFKALEFADIGFTRDTDSRITERDRWCIQAFLDSNYKYHIIRDHIWHRSKIMGGLFGWKEHRIFEFDENYPSAYGYDESVLSQLLYPLIRDTTLVHTNIIGYIHEHTERIQHTPTDNRDFVGNVYKTDIPEFTYFVDILEHVKVLQRDDQFSLIQYLSDSIDPFSIPYNARSEFYDTCFIANFYLRDVSKCQYWLSKFEFAEITQHNVYNSNFLFDIMKKSVIATFDETREPNENEVVIVYGAYPEWHLAMPCSNKMFRHISLFEKTKHDVVEYDPSWEPVDIIYILNLEERVDRYYETLLSLASVRAPLHRIHHYKAQRDGLPPYVGATKNHVDVVDHFCKSGLKHCLILEDDILFIDRPTVHSAFQKLFSKPRDYNICFLSLSKIGRREPFDDLLGQALQACTTSSAYFLQSSTAHNVYRVLLEGFNKMTETGDHHTYCVDRYWSCLPNLHYFRKKLAFQRPSYSNLTRGVSAHLD
jgi:hypothetical protein